MNSQELSIAELRAAVTRVLDAAEERFGEDLTFAEDLYWNVPFTRATSIGRKPRLDLGSLSDDVESVRDFLASDKGEHVSIWHELEHLGGVLRAISRLDVR